MRNWGSPSLLHRLKQTMQMMKVSLPEHWLLRCEYETSPHDLQGPQSNFRSNTSGLCCRSLRQIWNTWKNLIRSDTRGCRRVGNLSTMSHTLDSRRDWDEFQSFHPLWEQYTRDVTGKNISIYTLDAKFIENQNLSPTELIFGTNYRMLSVKNWEIER